MDLPPDLAALDAFAQSYETHSPRVALVTGAAQGIGYAIAHRLASDGVDVAVNDIPTKSDRLHEVASELRGKGCRALVVPADVSEESEVVNMIDKTVQELGGLDIVSKSSANRT